MMAAFCAEPGCGVIVAHGRCPAHASARGSRHDRGYDNRWARRAAYFRAHFPLCGMRPNGRPPVMSQCYDEGRTTIAAHVDHVVPHRGDPVLFWDELENWQALCASCHMRKTVAGL